MADERFTDVAVARDADGIYDLVIDEAGRDLGTTDGYETALFCSLFSDRRAAADEVADPFKRRGWIGNLTAATAGDNYGSGLWLYEQRRATTDVRVLLAAEARTSLVWMIESALVSEISTAFTYDPQSRKMVLTITERSILGGVSHRSYEIWQATGTRQLATNR